MGKTTETAAIGPFKGQQHKAAKRRHSDDMVVIWDGERTRVQPFGIKTIGEIICGA